MKSTGSGGCGLADAVEIPRFAAGRAGHAVADDHPVQPLMKKGGAAFRAAHATLMFSSSQSCGLHPRPVQPKLRPKGLMRYCGCGCSPPGALVVYGNAWVTAESVKTLRYAPTP